MAPLRSFSFVVIISLTGCAGAHSQATRGAGARSTTHTATTKVVSGQVAGVPAAARVRLHLQPTGAIAFQNAVQGFGVGTEGNPGALLETVDGGRSWARVGAVGAVTDLRAEPGGLAVTPVRGRTLYVTREAGVTRVTRIGRLRPGPAPPAPTQPGDRIAGSTTLPDTTDAFAWGTACRRRPCRTLLLSTVNGGRTWLRIELPGVLEESTIDPVTPRLLFAEANQTLIRSTDGGRSWKAVAHARFPGVDSELRWHVTVRHAGGTAWALLTSVSIMNQEAYVVYRSTDAGHTFTPIFAGSYADPYLFDLLDLPEIDAFAGPFTALPRGGAVFLGSCTVCDPQRWTALVTHDSRTWTRTTYPGAMPQAVPAWLTRP